MLMFRTNTTTDAKDMAINDKDNSLFVVVIKYGS